MASFLDEQFSRSPTERFDACRRDQNTFGNFQAPVFLPQPRHEMEGHAGLEHCFVARTQAHGALAPIRRSEEHTSELQSLMRISYAVFCLKKKTTQTRHTNLLQNKQH